jgi:hypothetical protein
MSKETMRKESYQLLAEHLLPGTGQATAAAQPCDEPHVFQANLLGCSVWPSGVG